MSSIVSSYESALQDALSRREISIDDARFVLSYVTNIFENGALPIFDADHLSFLSGFDVDFIWSVANAQDKFYRSFEVRKRSGGARRISEPLPDLKIFQRWMLKSVLGRISYSKYAKAYISGSSIKSHARLHLNRDAVLSIDVKDFFDSIKFFHVMNLFSDIGYSRSISALLSALCTLRGSLPQGAPTSAALSNLYMKRFDEYIGATAHQLGYRYSRYADDIVLSGSGNIGLMVPIVRKELRALGLSINDRKVKIMRRGSRQVTCGIVLNEKMGPDRARVRLLRQEAYYIEKFGVDSHLERRGIMAPNYLSGVVGRAQFYKWASPAREAMGIKMDRIIQLARRL